MFSKVIFIYIWSTYILNVCVGQVDPDPWNVANEDETVFNPDSDVPPDLRAYSPKKKIQTPENLANGEWFFRRMLAIVLKGGRNEINEDGSVEVSLQMRFDHKRWETLDEYIKTNMPLSEEMFRRSIGYVENAIYKPTITEKLAMAWTDYVQVYLTEYKIHITWTLAALGGSLAIIKLWNNMSHKHIVIIIIILLYLYEVFVSYKEAEQQELQKFISAINKCKWYFWTSHCDIPAPDILIFLKHMNPLKIGVRMFTTVISEPMIVISDTLKTMIHGITDGLWFPLDKIVYGMLLLSFNILLMFLLIMVVFNYILNIPFNLNIFGLFSLGVKQRNRTLFNNVNETSNLSNDRIAGANLDKLLDICARAINNSGDNSVKTQIKTSPTLAIKRSASAGRLTDVKYTSNKNIFTIENATRKRQSRVDGSGDAS